MERASHMRRCRHTATGLAVLLGVLLLVPPRTALGTEGWQTFTHSTLGFSLSYPDSWAETKGPSGVVFMALGPAPAGVQGFRMNVNVTYEEIPSGMNVEDYEAQTSPGWVCYSPGTAGCAVTD